MEVKLINETFAQKSQDWSVFAGTYNGVALIYIKGELYPDSWYSANNTNKLLELVECAKNDKSIKIIAFVIDSPGGSISGVVPLATAIKECQIPTIAYCISAHSGAYWVASQCDYIYAPKEIDQVIGSVGCYITHFDYSKRLEMDGIKPTIIKSKGSPKKARFNPFEPLDESTLQDAQGFVDEVYNSFVSAIKTKRKNAKDESFTGESFNPKQALALGLIDEIADLSTAMEQIFSQI